MKKSYAIRKVEKILRELESYRHSLAYLTSIEGVSGMTLRQMQGMKKRIRYLSRTIDAIEHSLGFLSPAEQKIIAEFYFKSEHSFDAVCEACALEKSSIYRYRARALQKLAVAMFGDEVG